MTILKRVEIIETLERVAVTLKPEDVDGLHAIRLAQKLVEKTRPRYTCPLKTCRFKGKGRTDLNHHIDVTGHRI